jgi:predicted HAD superfamily phosphohydrolase YqeG
MRRIFLASIAALLALTACSSTMQPNDANFRKAINKYLTRHSAVCTVIGRQFPIDVPRSEQSEHFGIGPKS